MAVRPFLGPLAPREAVKVAQTPTSTLDLVLGFTHINCRINKFLAFFKKIIFSAFFRVAGNRFKVFGGEIWKDLVSDFDLVVESTDGWLNNSLTVISKSTKRLK